MRSGPGIGTRLTPFASAIRAGVARAGVSVVHGKSQYAGKEGREKFRQEHGGSLDALRASLKPKR